MEFCAKLFAGTILLNAFHKPPGLRYMLIGAFLMRNSRHLETQAQATSLSGEAWVPMETARLEGVPWPHLLPAIPEGKKQSLVGKTNANLGPAKSPKRRCTIFGGAEGRFLRGKRETHFCNYLTSDSM